MTETNSAPRSNKYKGKCVTCSELVPARAGTIEKRGRWVVLCCDCGPAGDPGAFDEHAPNRYPAPASNRGRYGSTYARFSSGAEIFTNRNGRCEDSPCCGCCS